MNRTKILDIDQYIEGFPEETRKILTQIRETVREAAPEAVETIKYGMPAFTLNGNLIYFAAYKNHIAIYPAPSGNNAFNKEISSYRASKSSLRFPADKPIPSDLLRKIIKFRIMEFLEKSKTKT